VKGTQARSVSECEEKSHASSNPDLFLLSTGELKIEAEVGGVTRSGQSARTGEHFVNGALVDPALWLLAIFLRQKPNQRELSVELLRVRFVKEVGLSVPASALHVHSIDEAAILRRFADG
jgi:hypothetical protein